jgi:glycosyltransferase involved in cell wall biosynthesis
MRCLSSSPLQHHADPCGAASDAYFDRYCGKIQPRLAARGDVVNPSQFVLDVADVTARTPMTSRIGRFATAILERIRRPADLARYGRLAWTIASRHGLRGLGAEVAKAVSRANSYPRWIEAYDSLSPDDLAAMRRQAARLATRPLISVLMPVFDTPEALLREAIESVLAQTYDHWELCVADDASSEPHVARVLDDYARRDSRVRIVRRSENGHIARASNSALEIASGEWLAFLDHDDVLAPHALFCVAHAIDRHPQLALIYSDEDKLDARGRRCDPYFKCDWNLDLFRSHNLVTHLAAYRTELVRRLGGLRPGFEGAQDYDLALRVIEHVPGEAIHHIPHVLYHWRAARGSTALDAQFKPYAMRAGERALNEHLARIGARGSARYDGIGYRVSYDLPDPAPPVTLIVPTRNGGPLLQRCIDAIAERTTYPSYEILIVDNGSDDAATLAYLDRLRGRANVRVERDDRPFNFAAINNTAVRQAAGAIVGLINDDTEIITPGWLTEMVGFAIQPGVGAVGARLWYPDETLQHGGVVLGIAGSAGRLHKGLRRGLTGYCGRAVLAQDFSAVTAACLVVRKDIYLDAGGLDEASFPIAFNDVDFCLKLRAKGFRNVWTPFAELYHHESASRGYEETTAKRARFAAERLRLRERWSEWLAHDPAYSPNLTLERENASLAFPPRVGLPWRGERNGE